MIDYNILPDAPEPFLRDVIIEQFKASEDYKDDDVCKALIENIKNGYAVILHGMFCITKEGYNYINEHYDTNFTET